MPVLDLLEGDLAVQLLVAGDEDLTQAARGVEPEDAEPGPVGVRAAARVGPGGPDVVLRWGVAGYPGEAGLEVGVVDRLQVGPGGAERAERGQAPLGVAAVHREVLLDQRLQQGVGVGVEAQRSSRDLPNGRDLSATQIVKALSNASRSMKLFLYARRPNSRFSPASAGWQGRTAPRMASITPACCGNRGRYSSTFGCSPPRRR